MNKRKHYRLMDEADAGAAAGAAAGAGTGEGGAPAGGEGGNPAQTQSQNSTTPWHQSIADESLRTYAEGKGFKDVGEAAKALQDLESKYAVPADAAEYQLPVPEGDDGEFAKQASGWMKDAGIPAEAARLLAGKWNEFSAAQAQAAATAQQQAGEQAVSKLRGEWGDRYDANVDTAKRAVLTFGASAEVMDKMAGAIGDAEVIRLFQRVGAAMSESTLNPGDSGNNNPQGMGDTMKDIAQDLYGNSK